MPVKLISFIIWDWFPQYFLPQPSNFWHRYVMATSVTFYNIQYFFTVWIYLRKSIYLDLKYWISFWDRVGNKFLVKSRDSIFDTAAPSHYTVRWVSLQWRRWKTCETAEFISCLNLQKKKVLFFILKIPKARKGQGLPG